MGVDAPGRPLGGGRRAARGRVFDFETELKDVTEAYAAMDERRSAKSLLRVGWV